MTQRFGVTHFSQRTRNNKCLFCIFPLLCPFHKFRSKTWFDSYAQNCEKVNEAAAKCIKKSFLKKKTSLQKIRDAQFRY